VPERPGVDTALERDSEPDGGALPRIVFAGTPEFAVPALRVLIGQGTAPALVLTQPDRPAGRGRLPRPPPVKLVALEAGIEVLQPARIDAALIERLSALRPDLMVVVAYGLLLPPALLALPRCGCVNLHASLLPRWRGAAPIQRAIEAGDDETGVCLMQMDAGLDTGPVLARSLTRIEVGESAGGLQSRLSRIGAELLITQWHALLGGRLPAAPQAQIGVSYARRLDPSEAEIDWSLDAEVLARRVAAFNPWPIARTQWRSAPLRVHVARAEPFDADQAPGTVVESGVEGVLVQCGRGTLRLLALQAAGGRVLAVADFLRGRGIRAGDRLG
jgi:methionyl-tRNA formyltransferase